MSDTPQRFNVSMGWRLPDNRRIKITCQTQVVSYEADKDRWLVILGQMVEPANLDDIPAETSDLLSRLPGRWIYVPDEARNGTVLPLKYETLTGHIRYFYAQDPRIKQAE